VGVTNETTTAVILGGRWDGHEVVYNGHVVEYKGEEYVALLNDDGRIFYLLEALSEEWFRAGR
jgi:hypothetical protein